MRAARSIQPVAVAVPLERNSAALTLLAEVVAELAERIEVLETRERLGRPGLLRRKAGSAKARE